MSNVDEELRTELRRVAGDRLVELRRDPDAEGRTDSPEEAIRTVVARFFDSEASRRLLGGKPLLSVADENRLTREVLDHLLGLGPLQRLLDDPEITDIHVRGNSRAWVKRVDGTRVDIDPVVATPDELVELVRNAASRSSRGERRFDASTVECNLCLEDGSRLFAIMDVATMPSLVIRKHQFQLSSLSQLQSNGLLTPELSDFFSAAVRARRNIVIAGGTGSGKTTLLRALMNEVPSDERIVTIEDAYELGLDRFADRHPDHDVLQSRPANIEGHGEVSLADLTRMALRMDPDRVVVGEVRGAEAFPMLLAMGQGNNGSMCTLHADSTRGVFPKLAAYVSMANTGLPIDIVNLVIANALHIVVHVEVIDGRRHLTSIREVVDADGPRIVSNEIFRSVDDGPAAPAFPMSGELRERLERQGFDCGVAVWS